MTKQELLTGMAIECATWEDAHNYAMREVMAGNVKRDVRSPTITKQEWLDMRERAWPWEESLSACVNANETPRGCPFTMSLMGEQQ